MGKKPYALTRAEVVDVLTLTASRAVSESRVTHPADIANVIMSAVESAAEAIDVLRSRGILDWERG